MTKEEVFALEISIVFTKAKPIVFDAYVMDTVLSWMTLQGLEPYVEPEVNNSKLVLHIISGDRFFPISMFDILDVKLFAKTFDLVVTEDGCLDDGDYALMTEKAQEWLRG